MQVNMHEAKTDISRLVALVEAGEEVIIARNGHPVVRLSLVRKERTQQDAIRELDARIASGPSRSPFTPGPKVPLKKGQLLADLARDREDR